MDNADRGAALQKAYIDAVRARSAAFFEVSKRNMKPYDAAVDDARREYAEWLTANKPADKGEAK